MASLGEDFRDCSICMIAFQDPKVLPCGHTFCSPCIEQMTDRQSKYIRCPSCNKMHHDGEIRPDFAFKKFCDALDEQNAQILAQFDEINAKTVEVENKKSELMAKEAQIDTLNSELNEKKAELESREGELAKLRKTFASANVVVSPDSRCHIHRHRVVHRWCEDCQEWLCTDCIKELHSHCSTKALKDVDLRKANQGIQLTLRDVKTELDGLKTKIEKLVTGEQLHATNKKIDMYHETMETDLKTAVQVIELRQRVVQGKLDDVSEQQNHLATKENVLALDQKLDTQKQRVDGQVEQLTTVFNEKTLEIYNYMKILLAVSMTIFAVVILMLQVICCANYTTPNDVRTTVENAQEAILIRLASIDKCMTTTHEKHVGKEPTAFLDLHTQQTNIASDLNEPDSDHSNHEDDFDEPDSDQSIHENDFIEPDSDQSIYEDVFNNLERDLSSHEDVNEPYSDQSNQAHGWNEFEDDQLNSHANQRPDVGDITLYETVGLQQWHEISQQALPCKHTFALCIIQNELWCCCGRDGIVVFDTDLQQQRTIPADNMLWMYDAVDEGNGDVVVAALMGLYLRQNNGAATVKIADGTFTRVAIHQNLLYAAEIMEKRVQVFHYESGWQLQKKITVQLQWDYDGITLAVWNNRLFCCSNLDTVIHVYSPSGELLQTHGEPGHGSAGQLFIPYILDVDDGGSVLIADYGNNRLQVMIEQQEFSVLQLQPPVSRPRGAVLINNKLYVTSSSTKTISRYVVDPGQ